MRCFVLRRRSTSCGSPVNGRPVLIAAAKTACPASNVWCAELTVGNVTAGGGQKVTVSVRPPPGTPARAAVNFDASSYTASEFGPGATVTVTLSEELPILVQIPLTATGHGGAASGDWSGVPESVTILAHRTLGIFTVTATDDADEEGRERVQLGFGELPPNVTAGSRSVATVALADNDGRSAAEEGDLRLAGYLGSNAGQVEVMHDGQWGMVCSGGFVKPAADVACRQLGFTEGEPLTAGSGTQGRSFWLDLDATACEGTESRLVDCQNALLRERHCPHYNVATVSCSETQPCAAALTALTLTGVALPESRAGGRSTR